ncbi:MAG: nucleotide-binding domain containing protein, partial [Deltaproteobacteria bacterium]
QKIVDRALKAIAGGHSVILHTAIGPHDLRISAMAQAAEKLSLQDTEADEILGNALGEMARDIVGSSQVKRLVIAGGDTAGRIQQSLQIEALQVSKSIGIAAPLCYVYSKQPEFNGLEMAFKGGQIGSRDYLHRAQCARTIEFKDVALGII